MNRILLEKLLTIEDGGRMSIFDIVGRMKVLLELFKRDPKYKNLVPFLKTYYLVTKSVAERNIESKGYFDNPDKLRALDVHFANLYFEPLRSFLLEGKQVKPWTTYFQYCQRKNGIPFVQMFLGINAHINSDLLVSLSSLHYNEHKDFLRINRILKEEIPDVMKFLVKVDHDLFGLGALVFKNFALREFKNVIVSWREQVWKSAQNIRSGKSKLNKKEIFQKTEDMGSEIINVFENLHRFRDVSKMVSKINRLSMRTSS